MSDRRSVGEDGNAYCERDFIDTFAVKCGKCSEVKREMPNKKIGGFVVKKNLVSYAFFAADYWRVCQRPWSGISSGALLLRGVQNNFGRSVFRARRRHLLRAALLQGE